MCDLTLPFRRMENTRTKFKKKKNWKTLISLPTLALGKGILKNKKKQKEKATRAHECKKKKKKKPTVGTYLLG